MHRFGIGSQRQWGGSLRFPVRVAETRPAAPLERIFQCEPEGTMFMAMSETASTLHDTHAAVRRLTTAGMLEPHAEAVVGEQVHLIQHNLATKVDI